MPRWPLQAVRAARGGRLSAQPGVRSRRGDGVRGVKRCAGRGGGGHARRSRRATLAHQRSPGQSDRIRGPRCALRLLRRRHRPLRRNGRTRARAPRGTSTGVGMGPPARSRPPRSPEGGARGSTASTAPRGADSLGNILSPRASPGGSADWATTRVREARGGARAPCHGPRGRTGRVTRADRLEVVRVDQIELELLAEGFDLQAHPLAVEAPEPFRESLATLNDRLLECRDSLVTGERLMPHAAVSAAKKQPPASGTRLGAEGDRDEVSLALQAVLQAAQRSHLAPRPPPFPWLERVRASLC